MGQFTKHFVNKVYATQSKGFIRQQHFTYLNATEWRNVEMAIEYGEFLREQHSMFAFPYFRQIADIWRIHRQSYQAARRHESRADIRQSDYPTMSFFIAVFTTMELLPKAFLSLFLGLFMGRDNQTTMQRAIGAYYFDYGNKLTTLQFYDHDHRAERLRLKQIYSECQDKTMTDRFSWWIVSLELRAKQLLSKIIRWFFHGDTGATTPDKTQVIVKYKDGESTTSAAARLRFQQTASAITQHDKVAFNIVDDNVYVKQNHYAKTYQTVYARLEVPRYMTFKDTLPALENADIHVSNIAGNEFVQVKCIVDAGDNEACETALTTLNQVDHANLLYTYQDRIHPHKRFCLFDVEVKHLHASVTALQKTATVHFIHNF